MKITVDVPPDIVARLVKQHRKRYEGKSLLDLSGPEACCAIASNEQIIEAEIQVRLREDSES